MPAPLDEAQRARIRALAADLPALWSDPATPMRERKRLIRLLVTDVTLLYADEHITAHVRLPGGACHSLTLPRPLRAWEAHTTPPATVAMIDELLADHTFGEAVRILNARGATGGWGKPFTVPSLTALCKARGIPGLRQRLRDAGMLTLDEMAARARRHHADDQEVAAPGAHHRPADRRAARVPLRPRPGPPLGRTIARRPNPTAETVTPVRDDGDQAAGAIGATSSTGGAV